MDRMDTKYDLSKEILTVLKKQAAGQVSFTDDATVRVEAVAALV